MTKEQVLEKLKFDVELRGLSKNTQDEYYTKCKMFQNHFDKPATELDEKDIREFLYFLTTEKNSPLEVLIPIIVGFVFYTV